MKIGTRSLLFGAHCFPIHTLFLAVGWVRLFGLRSASDPYIGRTSILDIRLWIAFVVHDLGYWGRSGIDTSDGELHPILGARILTRLFDAPSDRETIRVRGRYYKIGPWGQFSLFHSRYIAREAKAPLSHSGAFVHSTLCLADKFATALEPSWLYLPRVWASQELHEFMRRHDDGVEGKGKYSVTQNFLAGAPAQEKTTSPFVWHRRIQRNILRWIATHRRNRTKA